MTITILVYDNESKDNTLLYQDYLKKLLPHMTVITWNDITDCKNIDYIVTGFISAENINKFPNLKAIISLWAGINYLISQDGWNKNIPLYRMIDDKGLTAGMREYVIAHVLYYHNQIGRSINAQNHKKWQSYRPVLARHKTVGIMGAGVLGRDVGYHLAQLGFFMKCWTRTQRDDNFADNFYGDDQLLQFLQGCDYLVNLLPATKETNGILNKERLYMLAKNAVIINSGRGNVIVDEDLITALDDGHLQAASLDVFHEEPLPRHHPFWSHPCIIVTPHIASITNPDTASHYIADVITQLQSGKSPKEGLVDFSKGY